ncbi:MAG: pseudouridine synthase [Lewinellaceae bacterium]|nr:pseudouridine synthase [Saprospiraceae bacterium]MCB9311459.1 pseudouridine synthase [Lewinellaceae bacterium]
MAAPRYFTIYKPYGVLCQFTPDHPGQQTLADLYALPTDIYPVGRLDQDSEGLLLMTNDNALKSRVLSPESKVEKTYWAQVEGQIMANDLLPLQRGIAIRIKGRSIPLLPVSGRVLEHPPLLPDRTPPIRFRKSVPDSWVELVLQEGKNRQVRRMMAAIGFPVLRLVRARIANVQLGTMLPGDIREWTSEEMYQQLGISKFPGA